MRTLMAVAVLAAGAGALCGQPAKKFESKEGKFAAMFPKPPAPPYAKTAGGLTLNLVHLEVEKDKSGYLITYSDLPAEVLKAPKPEQVLETSEKTFKEKFSAKEV